MNRAPHSVLSAIVQGVISTTVFVAVAAFFGVTARNNRSARFLHGWRCREPRALRAEGNLTGPRRRRDPPACAVQLCFVTDSPLHCFTLSSFPKARSD